MAERRASTTRYVKLRIFAGQLLAAVQSTVISVSETATTRQVLRLTLGQLEIKEKPENFELVEVCYRDSVLDDLLRLKVVQTIRPSLNLTVLSL